MIEKLLELVIIVLSVTASVMILLALKDAFIEEPEKPKQENVRVQHPDERVTCYTYATSMECYQNYVEMTEDELR